MGLGSACPKSLIRVREESTFLDITMAQIEVSLDNVCIVVVSVSVCKFVFVTVSVFVFVYMPVCVSV